MKKNKSIYMKLNKVTFLFIILTAVIFSTSCTDDPPVNSELTLEEELQNTLDEGLIKYGGKGISVAVIMPDGYLWKGVSGISHGSTKIKPDMVFSIGSTTKSFTAANIMILAQEDKLNLDDSLHKWLPAIPYIDSTINIRQLLNHTNGIYNFTEHPTVWQDIFSNSAKVWEIEELVRSYTLESYFPKGTDWHYSNTGYLLLRIILRSASNSQISNEYRSRFFNPLRMSRSYLAIEENPHGEIAHGWFDYTGDGEYDDLNLISMNAFYSGVGGGVFSTAEELALWIKALLKDKIVVSESSLNQMINFHSPCPDEPLLSGYGLGIVKYDPSFFNGINVIGHSGDAPGYAAGSLYLPDYGVCIGIVDNTENGDAMPVINDLIDVVLSHLNN